MKDFRCYGKNRCGRGHSVNCTATRTSVTCAKTGGLTATLLVSGVVAAPKAAPIAKAVGTPMLLHTNKGFVNARANNSNAYFHVYLAPAPTLDCALTGTAPSGHLPGSHGFDISARSVSVFRFDRPTGNLVATKTYAQP